MSDKTYSGLTPAGPWPGGKLYSAQDAAGRRVFLREAGKTEAGAAPYLSHPSLPVFLGEWASDSASPAKFLVYEYFEGRSLAEAMAGGAVFTQFEALKLAYDAASALKYLHGLSPRVTHGAVSAAAVFRAGGGRGVLCGAAGGGDAAGDLRGLAGLLRALAAAPKGGKFSPGYMKLAEQLELPGATADGIVKAMESLAAGPGYLPAPGRALPVNYRPFLRKAAALAVLALSFLAAFKFRVEYWPQVRSRRNIKLETTLNRDYPCAQLPPLPTPQLGANLLENPGFEGACGWHSWGGWERGMIRKNFSGKGGYYVELPGPDFGVWQDADVSIFSSWINTGACTVRLSGRLRAEGYGKDGEPYLFGYAMRSENDYSYLSGFQPVSSIKWTPASMEWPLPPGTVKVRVVLQKSAQNGSWLSKSAFFDDVSAEVNCR